MRKKTAERKDTQYVICRTGNHRVPRNMVVVHYEPGYGLCGRCIVQRCDCIAEYWTKGRAVGPVEQSAQLGKKD